MHRPLLSHTGPPLLELDVLVEELLLLVLPVLALLVVLLDETVIPSPPAPPWPNGVNSTDPEQAAARSSKQGVASFVMGFMVSPEQQALVCQVSKTEANAKAP